MLNNLHDCTFKILRNFAIIIKQKMKRKWKINNILLQQIKPLLQAYSSIHSNN